MFTYNLQLAGYPYEKYDEKGSVDLEGFKIAFNAFPWLEQADKREKLDDGCSATISVLASPEQKDLWVSIAGNRQGCFLSLVLSFLKQKKGCSVLEKKKQ